MEGENLEIVPQVFFQLEEMQSFSALPATNKTEIKDPMILAKVDNLLATTGKVVTQKVGKNRMAQKVLSDTYKVTIPRGTELLTKNSGELTGIAVKVGTRNGIKGLATLEKVNPVDVAKMNPATVAFEAAGMITAQHYMAEIQEELQAINSKLDSLINLQKNDIVGMLKSISLEVENLSKYSSENILDRDTRNIKRKSIEDYRLQVNKEFQKANDFLNQNVEYLNSKNLMEREKHLGEFHFWTQIQSFSLSLLEELAKLEFQYSPKNEHSRKQAFSIYEKNVDKATDVLSRITSYSEYKSGLKALFTNQKRIDEKVNLPIQQLQKIHYQKYDSEKLLKNEEKAVELILEDGKVYHITDKEK